MSNNDNYGYIFSYSCSIKAKNSEVGVGLKGSTSISLCAT